jgi:hypothetical protein
MPSNGVGQRALSPLANPLLPPRRTQRGSLSVFRAPLGLSLAVLRNVFPAVRPPNHRPDRKDEHIDQLVALMGGMGASGSGSGGKMSLER